MVMPHCHLVGRIFRRLLMPSDWSRLSHSEQFTLRKMTRFSLTHCEQAKGHLCGMLFNSSYQISSTDNCSIYASRRLASTGTNNLRKSIEEITEKFMEARELLDDAKSSHGTVYFSEDMEEAKQAVTDTLDAYKELMDSVSAEQKQHVITLIGLKMEELRAQQRNIEEMIKTE